MVRNTAIKGKMENQLYENYKSFSLYHVFSIRSGSTLCNMRFSRLSNVCVRIFEYTIYMVLCVNQRLSVKLHWLEFPSHVPHICCYGQHLVGGYFDREYTVPQNSKNEDHGTLSQTKCIIRQKNVHECYSMYTIFATNTDLPLGFGGNHNIRQ